MIKNHYKIIITAAIIVAVTCSSIAVFNVMSMQMTDLLLLMLVATGAFVISIILSHISLKKPFELISKSLDSESIDPIRPLLGKRNSFSGIANLIVKSFAQNQSLLHEIDERKKAENALKKSEELYRNLIETSPDSILLFNTEGKIEFYNTTAASLLGFNFRKGPGPAYNFISSEELEKLKRQLDSSRHKRIRSFECTLTKSNGKLFPAEISVSTIIDNDDSSEFYLGICRDISFRKEMESEKNLMEEQFRVAHKMEAIGQLAGGISHDFNNILGAISGYADIIKIKFSDNEKLNKYANMILEASSRAADLTGKLLTFSRRGNLQFTDIDIHSMIRDIIDLFKHTVDKNITVNCNLNAVHPFIKGDPAQIQSAIMNIAINAFDSMPEGGSFSISTEDYELDENSSKDKAYTVSPGSYAKISFQDSGIGMNRVTKSKIFEPFFTTKKQGKGTGLGLASVYGTVKSHNGYIDVESMPGCGSTFTLFLPSVTVPTAVHKPKAEEFPDSREKKSILVIDDEKFLCNALKEMLSWMGYTVHTFTSAFESVDYYTANSKEIDLIILDLIMPGLSGKECFKLLQGINPEVKVIISSGYCLEPDRQELTRNGVVGFLQKPFVSAQLAQAVQNVVH